MRPTLAFLMLLIATGCATTHPGKIGEPVEQDEVPAAKSLKMSAAREGDYSDDHHVFLNFTFENLGDNPIRIKNTELEVAGEPAAPVAVITDRDLLDWAQATDTRLRKEKHNSRLLYFALLGSSLLTGGLVNNSDVQLASAGVALGGVAAWHTAEAFHAQSEARTPHRIPQEHIYAPFSVPPGNFLRKWAVVRVPSKYKAKKAQLLIEFEDGSRRNYAIAL